MRHTTPTTDDEFQFFAVAGRPYWRHIESGRIGAVIRGGDEGEGDDDGDEGGGDGDKPKTFTQADIDRAAGRARNEARRSAANELAEQLGVTVDEAKTIIANAKAAEDGKKSDADKALDAAKAAQAAADQARADAAADRLAAKVERKLIKAGVDDKVLTKAHRLLDLEPDADDDDIAAAVDALKADVPALFTTTTDDGKGKPPPPGGTGARPPAPKTTGKSMADLGAETAQRFGFPTKPKAPAA